jgi:glycosyltransferase involved in cell wall biosynthesis
LFLKKITIQVQRIDNSRNGLSSNSKKIKVCFYAETAYAFFSEQKNINHGGAELQLYFLSKTLAKSDNTEVSLITGDYGQEQITQKENIRLVKGFSSETGKSSLQKIGNAVKFFRLLKKIQPDILVTTTANALAGIAGLYAKMHKAKHLHRTAHLIDVNGSWIKQNRLAGILYRFGLKNADKIITQNDEHKKILRETHGLNSEVFKNIFPIKKQTQTDKKHVLWVGRFQAWKQPELFLRLAEKLPRQEFVMICPYHEKDYPAWHKLKKNAAKLTNLKLIQQVAFSEIQNYFNTALLFVNTSEAEGFPNTFLQAAQAESPIASLSVNPDGFITRYNCGIFAANDFNKLVNETKKLLDNPELLQQKGKNAGQYLKENHDAKILGKRFGEIITELAKPQL